MYPLTAKFCPALLHPNPQMHLVPTDFYVIPTSNALDAPNANRDLSGVSKQTPKPPKSKQSHGFDPSDPTLLHRVQERTQKSTLTVIELTCTNANYRKSWY